MPVVRSEGTRLAASVRALAAPVTRVATTALTNSNAAKDWPPEEGAAPTTKTTKAAPKPAGVFAAEAAEADSEGQMTMLHLRLQVHSQSDPA